MCEPVRFIELAGSPKLQARSLHGKISLLFADRGVAINYAVIELVVA